MQEQPLIRQARDVRSRFGGNPRVVCPSAFSYMEVMYEKGKVISNWEQTHGMHSMYNIVFEFADEIGLAR